MSDVESLSQELHWIPGLNSDEYTKMMREKAAAERALLFDMTPKDTGVLHEDPEARVAKALEKMR